MYRGSTAIQFPWLPSAELVVGDGSNANLQPGPYFVTRVEPADWPTWIVVDVSAHELFLDTRAGPVGVPNETIMGQAQRRSSLWLWLSWKICDVSHQIALDLAAGGRYAVYGTEAEASILAPAGSRSFDPGSDSQQTLVGQSIGFCQASVIMARSSVPLGDRHGRCSQRVRVDANDSTRETSVPPCASSLQIYEAGAGAAPSNDPWTWVASGPTRELWGPVNLTAGESERVDVPGFAHGLTMASSAGTDRDYSFVYRVEW